MLPHAMSQAEVDDVVAQVTPAMIEKSHFIGTPADVAAQLAPWVAAGADYIAPSDMAPAVLQLEEQEGTTMGMLELCAALKAAVAATV